MKKKYDALQIVIERFDVKDVLTVSVGKFDATENEWFGKDFNWD